MKNKDFIKNCLIQIVGTICNLVYKIHISYQEGTYLKNLNKSKNDKVIIQYPSSLTYENIILGKNIYIGPNSKIWATHSKIIFNDNIIVGPNLTIMGGDHNYKKVGEYIINNKVKDINDDRDIIIKEDCWIGCNVTILKGVVIEKGAIVAANSVVTKNVGAYSIVAGNPAIHIKQRFSSEEIKIHEKKLLI